MMSGDGAMPKELQVEMARFKENLAECRNNIVQQWQTKLLAYKEISRRNKAELQKRKDEMMALRKLKTDEVYMIEGLMEAMKLEADGHLLEREKLEEKSRTLETTVEKNRIALEERAKIDSNKFEELQRTVTKCQKSLGLDFKKVQASGYKLQIVFNNLDRKDPSSLFVMNVAIKNRSYEVSECDPPVDDLSDLVDELNTTNDFRSFIIVMRQRFKDYCSKGK